VADAVHDLLHASACGCCERRGDVTKVVEVQVRDADQRPRGRPLVLPDRFAQRSALGAGEDPRIVVGIGEGAQVLEQCVEGLGGRATVRRPASEFGGPMTC